MSDKKISELPVADPLVGTELFPVVQDSETRHSNVMDVSSFLSGKYVASSTVVSLTSSNMEPAVKVVGDLWIDKSADPAAILPVSDIPYSVTWSGFTTIAPSKKSVYDKIEAVDLEKLDKTGDILGTYFETGATLSPISGVLTIPLDGRVYAVSVTEAITSIVTTAPIAPIVGSTVVYFSQDVIGLHAVSIPATWYWADGMITPIATAANAKTRLTLVTSPAGDVHADAEVRSVPA